MIRERDVAVFASVVDAAALHLDCNNVAWSVIVLATSLRIKTDAANLGNRRNHREPRKTMAEREGFYYPRYLQVPVNHCTSAIVPCGLGCVQANPIFGTEDDH